MPSIDPGAAGKAGSTPATTLTRSQRRNTPEAQARAAARRVLRTTAPEATLTEGKAAALRKRLKSAIVDHLRAIRPTVNELHAEGMSDHDVARTLNERGVLSDYWGRWTATGVRRVLDGQAFGDAKG